MRAICRGFLRQTDATSSLKPMKGDSLGQLIITGVPGKELEPATTRLFRKVQPGAFILFGRNIESTIQLRLQMLITSYRESIAPANNLIKTSWPSFENSLTTWTA